MEQEWISNSFMTHTWTLAFSQGPMGRVFNSQVITELEWIEAEIRQMLDIHTYDSVSL